MLKILAESFQKVEMLKISLVVAILKEAGKGQRALMGVLLMIKGHKTDLFCCC
jgi:hypothetical protein